MWFLFQELLDEFNNYNRKYFYQKCFSYFIFLIFILINKYYLNKLESLISSQF